MGMTPLSFDEALQYWQGLGQRHPDIVTSEVGLPEQFKALHADKHPLFLVEADPLIEQTTPGLDTYSLAFQVLIKPARTNSVADPDLVAQCKALADECLEQARWERVIEIDGRPTYLPIYNTGTDALATGVRVDVRVKVQRPVARQTTAAKFAPLP